jgi:hypothetical protein
MEIQISGSTKGVFVANTTYSRDAFIIVFLDTWYERIVFVLLVILLVIVVCYLLLLDTGTGTGTVYRYAQRFKDIVHTGTVPGTYRYRYNACPKRTARVLRIPWAKTCSGRMLSPAYPRFRIPHLFLLV